MEGARFLLILWTHHPSLDYHLPTGTGTSQLTSAGPHQHRRKAPMPFPCSQDKEKNPHHGCQGPDLADHCGLLTNLAPPWDAFAPGDPLTQRLGPTVPLLSTCSAPSLVAAYSSSRAQLASLPQGRLPWPAYQVRCPGPYAQATMPSLAQHLMLAVTLCFLGDS